jgi:hypothetical protein
MSPTKMANAVSRAPTKSNIKRGRRLAVQELEGLRVGQVTYVRLGIYHKEIIDFSKYVKAKN